MEFMMGAAEMTVELGKGCRDIVKQSLVNEDSYIARHFGRDSYFGKRIRGPYEKLCGKLSFFNDYLTEDKDPLQAWSVIFFVSLITFMYVTPPDTDVYSIPKVLAPMPQKYIRCAKSNYGSYNVTEPPIDAPRDPLYKMEREIQKLQTHGVQNPHSIKYNGTLQGLKYIWRTEGFRGLFKGNGTNCARIVPNSAVKFFSYEQASKGILWLYQWQTGNEDAQLTPLLRLGAGACAGIIATSASYPMDMVRGRIIVQRETHKSQ